MVDPRQPITFLPQPGDTASIFAAPFQYALRCGEKILVIGDPSSSFASVKASVDIIVIDGAERPSEN